ncbi:glycosyltransferase [Salinibacter ruber]|uniref:glycosyltransferase n=1 Tax=Salinibacter ruber TaxID=146919 RepID=UPI00355B9D23
MLRESDGVTTLDLFDIPSQQGAFGVTTFESSALLMPVVGVYIGGIPDIVCPRRTGWLAEKRRRAGAARCN